jgi:hypothetical protein
MIRGIGPVYAKRLLIAFGEKVSDVIEVEPDRPRSVSGIGAVRAIPWEALGWPLGDPCGQAGSAYDPVGKIDMGQRALCGALRGIQEQTHGLGCAIFLS